VTLTLKTVEPPGGICGYVQKLAPTRPRRFRFNTRPILDCAYCHMAWGKRVAVTPEPRSHNFLKRPTGASGMRENFIFSDRGSALVPTTGEGTGCPISKNPTPDRGPLVPEFRPFGLRPPRY